MSGPERDEDLDGSLQQWLADCRRQVLHADLLAAQLERLRRLANWVKWSGVVLVGASGINILVSFELARERSSLARERSSLARSIGTAVSGRRVADRFVGRLMPCGHRYEGEQSTINGLVYYQCAHGHPWPQLNQGGLLAAEQVSPPPAHR